LNRILFVPGKNPKPPATLHHAQLLRCLLHGVAGQNAAVAAAIRNTDAFRLIAWNYLFYHHNRDINRDIVWVDRLLAGDPATGEDPDAARPASYRLPRLLYQAADIAPWLIPLLPDRHIKASIQETERYFANVDNIACRIRETLKRELRRHVEAGDRLLLIGHSMGSIIAYDVLWELHHLEGITRCIDCLLTIGSPLGMRYVQKRLQGAGAAHPRRFPGNFRRWVNVAARGDLVALDPSLADDFSEMTGLRYIDRIEDHNERIFNHYRDDRGLNVHKSYGYLVNPLVGRIIADWWTGT